jgi:DNA-binding NtrC family response regulator
MAAIRFNAADREFFYSLDQVVYGNPFTPERAALVQRILPDAAPEELTVDRDAVAQIVEPRVRSWNDAQRRGRLPSEDLRALQSAILYVCYHRHITSIDALIDKELSLGQPPAADHIARSVIAELAEGGFSRPAATRYFGFFFQLRRAFHFILHALPGECPSMRALRRALWDNVFTHDLRVYQDGLWSRMEDFSTLLLGETGTGKGAAAAAIGRSQYIAYLPDKHRFAASFMGSFISVNLSQFPETLIESELFGHKKGAFTGAIGDHAGLFSRCSQHGALFLDEIGEVSIPVQIKLLRVLQERTFTPVGGHETLRFAGRVIAATNRDLMQLRTAGRFREDFFYRLCSDVIEVPTLRQRIAERAEELHDLSRVLIVRIAGEPNPTLESRVLETLEHALPREYAWPGNVRELEQAIRRIMLTGRYQVHRSVPAPTAEDQLCEQLRSGALNADELLDRYCDLLYRRLGTYAEVATRTGLDRRTARRRISSGAARSRT